MQATSKALVAVGLALAVIGTAVAASRLTTAVAQAGHVGGAKTAAARAATTEIERMAATGDIHAGHALEVMAQQPSLAKINGPVLGLYGGMKEDARMGATIAATEAKMKELKKTFEVHVFEGAAHGFLRAQSGNNGANMKATHDAWPLTVAWIKKHAQ